MEEQGCPRCKTTKYRNPSLKLMVNICGHSLCESCVDLMFIKGSGTCPECGTALRRSHFRLQLFEDPYIEKEVDIRKMILKDFNKKEEDFTNLNDYNDYLEMIESIIYNLTNNIDVETTKRQIESYKKDNKDLIKKNKSKLSKDEEYLEMLIQQEKHESEVQRQLLQEDEARQKNIKLKNKEALIDELMFSEMAAADIMASHRELTKVTDTSSTLPKKAATEFSTGIKLGAQDTFIPLSKMDAGELYRYEPTQVFMCGPKCLSEEELVFQGYLNHVRRASDIDLGGGYKSVMACQRALQDSFCGLYYFPNTAS
ncbi:hypothetical protein CHS0354_040278 [Potamilus streckersoni]|uniref:CDK-activating kinase assembly factor MAT1 n=1 Tax=Potamilus streckersoni TaxID=2493646 RepID=A0AAE0S3H2_9BIVA|nr:hypothetical protein CHS0354_040278 [Potamilus streckersoni]